MKKIKPLNNEEIASFCGQMGMLLAAGIAPGDGVTVLLRDATDNEAVWILTTIEQQLRQGCKLHDALNETGCFPHYVVEMTAIGEESGTLDEVMNSLAAYYEREENIADNIKSAVTYPFIMIFMMLLVITVLLTKVLPIFNKVFVQLGTEMSGLSESLLKLGDNINKGSVAILIFLAVLLLLIIWFRNSKRGRKVLLSLLAHLPLTRDFYDQVAAGRFASALALSFASGMDTYTGLSMARDLVENKALEAKIDKVVELLKNQYTFAEALGKVEIFSTLYTRMISIGFKSGNLDTVLFKISDNYEAETDRKLHHMLSVIEPTLVIILSLIVGFILLSVILPLMSIMSSIG